MARLGRILQLIGWLWFAFGFLGPIFLDFDSISPFPGIVLVFIARVLRTQAARQPPKDPGQVPQPAPERLLNTERQVRSEEAPSPSVVSQPVTTPQPAPQPAAETETGDDRFTRFLRGEDELTPGSTPTHEALDELNRPKTSAEMLAEAKKRWTSRS